jgi:hypothetical protein
MVLYKINQDFKNIFFWFDIGDEDTVVQLRWARLTEQGIKAMGFKQYTFKEYKNMSHSSCDQVNFIPHTIVLYNDYNYYLGNGRCKFLCRTKLAKNQLTNNIKNLTDTIFVYLSIICVCITRFSFFYPYCHVI